MIISEACPGFFYQGQIPLLKWGATKFSSGQNRAQSAAHPKKKRLFPKICFGLLGMTDMTKETLILSSSPNPPWELFFIRGRNMMEQKGMTFDHDFYVVVGKQCRTENVYEGHQHNILTIYI